MIPIMNGAQRLIALQEKYPNEPVIDRALEAATEPYAYAQAYLAYWVYFGMLPELIHNPAGEALAKEVVAQLSKPKPSEYRGTVMHLHGHKKGFKSRYRLPAQTANGVLTTGVGSDGAYLGGLSEEGRRQAQEKRAKEGASFNRGGVITKKPKCKPFDTRVADSVTWWIKK